MNDDSLRKSIFENFSFKETDELLEIWQGNKRDEWSDLSFDVIEQILRERGVEIPPQDDPIAEPESDEADEVDEIEETPSTPNNQPIFYKPQELLFYIDAASVAAWIVLVAYTVSGLRAFLDSDFYSAPLLLLSAITTFLGHALTGVVSFAFLKGISLALGVLMEFEFNSRKIK